jgi:hypothetical protein
MRGNRATLELSRPPDERDTHAHRVGAGSHGVMSDTFFEMREDP